MTKILADNFGRRHDYLRISVTDRCDLRCVYCMGPEGVEWLEHSRILSYEEIVQVVQAAAGLGITRIRLTGGEPLVRKHIEVLVRDIAGIPGITDLAMTTNGQLLADKASVLKAAGLKRVNISLDTLKPDLYRKITRCGDLEKTLAGIRAALTSGLSPVKINIVLMKGINDEEIRSFLRLALEYPLHLRFIEYMPLDSHDREWQDRYLPLETVTEEARAMGFALEPIGKDDCAGPASMYRIPGGLGAIGLIHPVSNHFCNKCNRLRLTADGYIKPCLYWQDELFLRPFIGDPEGLKTLLQKALDYKRERHAMYEKTGGPSGGEEIRGMSRIGG